MSERDPQMEVEVDLAVLGWFFCFVYVFLMDFISFHLTKAKQV